MKFIFTKPSLSFLWAMLLILGSSLFYPASANAQDDTKSIEEYLKYLDGVQCDASNYQNFIYDYQKSRDMHLKSVYHTPDKNWCSLEGVDFSNNNLSGSFLYSLDLKNIKCKNTNFNGVTFVDTDLSFAQCEGATFQNAVFDNVNLTGANLTGANFKGASFIYSNVSLTNFTNAVWGQNPQVDFYIEGSYNDPIGLPE